MVRVPDALNGRVVAGKLQSLRKNAKLFACGESGHRSHKASERAEDAHVACKRHIYLVRHFGGVYRKACSIAARHFVLGVQDACKGEESPDYKNGMGRARKKSVASHGQPSSLGKRHGMDETLARRELGPLVWPKLDFLQPETRLCGLCALASCT